MGDPDTPEDHVNRLHDMTVEEVSLVDRAANKRRFLITKRKGEPTMPNEAELRPDGEGGFTAGPVEPVGTQKADSGKKLQSALDRLMSAANKVKEGSDPGELTAELRGVAEAILGVIEKYPKPTAKTDEVEDVEKRGAKMQRARLDRFKSAVSALQDVLKEIEPEDDGEPAAAPAAPTAGAAQAKHDEALGGQVRKLAGLIEGLAGAVREQKDRLDRVAKAAPSSAQVPVEDRSAPHPGCSWPMDMNRPLDRDHVAKEHSFHDA